VRYALKTPYRDGTTHVIFESEDFIARLAALVPKPHAHLTTYHGVFPPASPDRARIVPKTRTAAISNCGEPSPTDRQRAMSLKRNASGGCSPSISRPAANAAVGCASSPASRNPTLALKD
jgi:hypothetical protein